jgi:RNA polymerase sigma factor (sigma-70 family)
MRGSEDVKKSDSREQSIRHSFDCYCKRVVKRNALDIQRTAKRRRGREIPLSELPARELKKLAVIDQYFKDAYVFNVLSEVINISDVDLAEALNSLPPDRRNIILLSYFLDMPDREIADKLNMARRTVAYRRTSSLQELKNLLESEE